MHTVESIATSVCRAKRTGRPRRQPAMHFAMRRADGFPE